MLPGDGLNIKVSFQADTSGAKIAADKVKELEAQVSGLRTELQGAEKSSGKTAEGVQRVGKAADTLRNVGAAMTAAGGALSGALLMSARSYVQQIGTAEQASRRYLGASKDIEIAQNRIGRSVATAVVPAMEKAADLAEKIAAWSEKNPGAMKGVTYGATGLAAGGGLLIGASTLVSTLQKLGPLFKSGGALAGLGTMLATFGKGVGKAIISPAGAVVGGVLAGGAVNNALANTQVGQQLGLQNTNKFATVAAYGVGKLFGGEQTGLAWAQKIGEATGALNSTAAAAEKAGHELDFTSSQIGAYASYLRQEQNAERAYKIQLSITNRDFRRQEAIAEQDFTRQRGIALRNFHRQERLAEQDYYRQRAIQARDYGIEMVRAEEDYQRSRKRAQEDFQFEMWDILRSGDALAYMRAQRQYNISQQRAEEDYNIQISRRNEDFARQLADQAREFAIQRQRRAEEFAIQLKDEDEQFQIQRKRAKEEQQIRLRDMELQQAEERRQRKQAFYDQLRDMYGDLEKERLLRQQFNAAMLADLQAAINAARGGQGVWTNAVSIPQRAAGGYVEDGIYRMHSGEFVMNRRTTEAFENAIGSQLSQDNVLAALAGRGGAGGGKQQVIWNDHRTFSGSVSPAERAMIRQDTLEILSEVMNA